MFRQHCQKGRSQVPVPSNQAYSFYELFWVQRSLGSGATTPPSLYFHMLWSQEKEESNSQRNYIAHSFLSFFPHQNLSLFGPAQMMVICHYLFSLTLIISTSSSYAGPKHNCHKYRYVTSACPILMLTSLGLASENMIRYISLHGQGLLELVGELVALFWFSWLFCAYDIKPTGVEFPAFKHMGISHHPTCPTHICHT